MLLVAGSGVAAAQTGQEAGEQQQLATDQGTAGQSATDQSNAGQGVRKGSGMKCCMGMMGMKHGEKDSDRGEMMSHDMDRGERDEDSGRSSRMENLMIQNNTLMQSNMLLQQTLQQQQRQIDELRQHLDALEREMKEQRT